MQGASNWRLAECKGERRGVENGKIRVVAGLIGRPA
jgi:hypothetical protein